jgi:dihydroorotase
LIKNTRVVDPASKTDALLDVLVEDRKIQEIRKGIPEHEAGLRSSENTSKHPWHSGGEVIDAQGKILVPGLIDMHCHLREPGFEYKETIESGSRGRSSRGLCVSGLHGQHPSGE